MILAGRRRRRNPCEIRSPLSQFPSCRTSLRPTGQMPATTPSYADARFVNTIRSSATGSLKTVEEYDSVDSLITGVEMGVA